MGLVSTGKVAAYKRRHAQVLLKADQGEHGPSWTDAAIAAAFDVSVTSVERLRQRCVEEGLDDCLQCKPQLRRKARKLDGAAEARLTALACSAPPEGRQRWTLQLLADERVVLEVVDSICAETVRQTLKKTN